jgi:parallel beta-helix repeat protein
MALTKATFAMTAGAVANVLDYGAGKGAADDGPFIQNAIDAVNTAGGGTVYFPAGTYNIQTQLTPRSNVSYKGEAGKSILKINSTPGPTYTFSRTSLDISNVTWDGLTFDGSLNYPANSQVYKQTYANMNSGIRIGGVKATNITIKNCQFLSQTLNSIDINAPYSENISILDNYFYRGSYRSNVIMFRAQGITTDAERPSKILIQGNHIQQCGPQQFYDASKEDYVASCDGIQLDKCRDSIIANNTVNQTASIGIRVEDSLRVTVIGNVVTEPGGDGIVIYKNSADVSVIGNTIKNWGRIPPAYCMRNYSGTYVLAREFPSPSAAPLPANPTASAWFITWPYTTNGIDTATILTYSDTNYYGTTTNGILPFRGNSAINIHTNVIRVTVTGNVAEGNITQSGGLYNYSGDYGISAVSTANDSAAGVVGNNMANCLIAGNLVADPRVYRIYHPEYTDPINVRGPLQPATYIGNRDSSSAIWNGNYRVSQTGYVIGTGMQFAATNTITSGTGSPEGVVTAPVGSLFLRTNGGAGTTLYIKESGTGNTGWAAK